MFFVKHKRSNFIFSRLLINKKDFQKTLEALVFNQTNNKSYQDEINRDKMDAIILEALKISKKRNNRYITFGSVFASLTKDKQVEDIFFQYGAKKEDVDNVSLWEENYYKEFFLKEPLIETIKRVPGFADDWAYGYTPILNRFQKKILPKNPEYTHIHEIGRESEVKKIEEILSSSGKNNIILVGDEGVGILNVILSFKKKVARGFVLGDLKRKRVVALDMNKIISTAKDFNTMLHLLDKIFHECATAGNIILVIEDLHNYLSSKNTKTDFLDITPILAKYLSLNSFQLIATTDYYHFHSVVENNPSVLVSLQKLEIKEPNEEQTLIILEDLVPFMEGRHKVFISYYAVYETVYSAGNFIQDLPFPENAITLLSEVISYVIARRNYGKIILQDHVIEVISKKTGVPLGKISGKEKVKLLNLESLLHKRIIGQDLAISEMSEALRRARSGIAKRDKPIGTFLFLGPTGVGKTETAKALAEIYFGSEKRMIRLDMGEYKDKDSIYRLIGSIDKNVEAYFANKVRENPFSLILLDEFEKAHPDIEDLMLRILDEGIMTDVFQKKVSFKNSIIIATSNAGAEFIREYILSGQNIELLHDKLIEFLLKENIFKPEFLNRFDAVVVFKPLTKEEIMSVARLMLTNFAENLFKEKGIKVKSISDDLIEKIAELGYNPAFGAREMRRIIQERIENKIARAIIEGRYKYGSVIELDSSFI